MLLCLLFLNGCWPNPSTYSFFSEIEGHLFINGQPKKGVEIIRYYRSGWFKNPTTDTAITNSEGYFAFPHAKKFVVIEFLHQPTIEQTLKFEVNNSEYVAWSYFKGNYQELGEFIFKNDSVKEIIGRVSTEISHDEKKITLNIYVDESIETLSTLKDYSKIKRK